MSVDSIVIDTSLIINLFNGVSAVKELIAGRNLFVSVITEIEVLSFPGLTNTDKNLLKEFLSKCYIIDLEPAIKEITISVRSSYKIKLPDSIIASTAIYFDMPLFTMDKGFVKVTELEAVILSV